MLDMAKAFYDPASDRGGTDSLADIPCIANLSSTKRPVSCAKVLQLATLEQRAW